MIDEADRPGACEPAVDFRALFPFVTRLWMSPYLNANVAVYPHSMLCGVALDRPDLDEEQQGGVKGALWSCTRTCGEVVTRSPCSSTRRSGCWAQVSSQASEQATDPESVVHEVALLLPDRILWLSLPGVSAERSQPLLCHQGGHGGAHESAGARAGSAGGGAVE